MSLAPLLIEIGRWWLVIGACVAVVFLIIGIDRIDEDARGAYAFRPLLIPAVLLIWPLILWRWIRSETGVEDWQKRYQPPRQVHLLAAVLMAAALTVAIVAGLSVRQEWPANFTPERLSEANR